MPFDPICRKSAAMRVCRKPIHRKTIHRKPTAMGQQYVVEYIKPVHSRPHQLYICPDSITLSLCYLQGCSAISYHHHIFSENMASMKMRRAQVNKAAKLPSQKLLKSISHSDRVAVLHSCNVFVQADSTISRCNSGQIWVFLRPAPPFRALQAVFSRQFGRFMVELQNQFHHTFSPLDCKTQPLLSPICSSPSSFINGEGRGRGQPAAGGEKYAKPLLVWNPSAVAWGSRNSPNFSFVHLVIMGLYD